MNPLTIKFMLNMYTTQKIKVRWNGEYSEPFQVTNGVRQGGVISPLLFTLYMDELICRLKKAGIGCHMGRYYCGILGFADDIVLLCPSLGGLRKMIKICEEYASEHSILFNGAKSKLLIFGKYEGNVCVKVNNETVPICTDAIHLGIVLNTKFNEKYDFLRISIGKFNVSFNYFNATYKTCYSFVKQKLFLQYCGSLYGAQLWPLWHKDIDVFYTQCRNALRKVWSIPIHTHCRYLPLITDSLPAEVSAYTNFLNFYSKAINSSNSIVRYVTNMSKHVPSSTMGRNLNHVLYKCNLNINDLHDLTEQQFKKLSLERWLNNVNDDDCQTCSVIKDMIHVRDGFYKKIIDNDECNFIIENLCTK